MAKTTNNQNPNLKGITRELAGLGLFRAIEGEGNERKFELSFSSEEPYDRGFLEILDHSDGAVDLYRLNNLGVVLFNHDRDQVVGKVLEARIEDGRGIATIEFDTDADADVIYQKVRGGTLRGVSVCYIVDDWEIVAAGEKSEDGRFTGPCDIARRWTPLEISIVSVPADPTVGVGRDMEEPEPEEVKRAPSNSVRQLQINLNKCL